jgi:uncharacterized membrane protein required for colicin V production
MISLTFFFIFLVILFAIIGASRGWAKEMLVTFSLVLGLFLIALLEEYVPIVSDMVENPTENQVMALFWLRFSILAILAFFGYQTPRLTHLNQLVKPRERLEDTLLGFILGALNAYLLIGSIWFYMAEAGYPFPVIIPPVEGTEAGDAAVRLLSWMAPAWLVIPYIYFAIAVAFIFVIVVFL